MKKQSVAVFSLLASAALFGGRALAQSSTPAVSPAELETHYTISVESRTQDILKPLGLTDAAKSNAVRDILIRSTVS